MAKKKSDKNTDKAQAGEINRTLPSVKEKREARAAKLARQAADENWANFSKNPAVQRLLNTKSTFIQEQLRKTDVQKEFLKNPAGVTSRLMKHRFLNKMDLDASTSTSIRKRVTASLYKAVEDKAYGLLGNFGEALKQSRRTSTAAEAKSIRRDYYLRAASNFIEGNFGVPGAAIAQRIRQNISNIKSDDPNNSFEAIKKNFTNINDAFKHYDNAIANVIEKSERAHKRIGALRVQLGLKAKDDAIDIKNQKIGIGGADLTEFNTKLTTLEGQYGDISGKVATLEGQVSNLLKNQNSIDERSTVPLVSGAVKVEKKKEDFNLLETLKEALPLALPAAIPLLTPLIIPAILAAISGALGLGAAALQKHVNKVRKNADPNRVGGWSPDTDPWQKTADRQALKDLVDEDAKRDNYEKLSKQSYEEMSAVDKIKHNVKKNGLTRGSMFPSVSGMWDYVFGKSKKKEQSTPEIKRTYTPGTGNPIDDRIYASQIEAQKSQFMQFGKLPGGFEFLPGHMGRLGQSSDVEAAGGQPVANRTSSGSSYHGNQSYSASGVTNTNAIIATSEEAKKVIAEAVAGKIPLEAAAVDRALKLEGLNEHRDRDTLKKFLAQGGRAIDPVSTPWCAAFVNATLAGAGIYGTGSLVATSFSNWGELKELADIKKGDVLVQSRGRGPGETGGHVGIFTGETKTSNGKVTHVKMLGGNQRGGSDVSADWVPVGSVQIRRATENQYSPEAKEALGLTKPGTAAYERTGNYEKVSGGIDRSQFEDELKNPDVRERFFTLMKAEVGSQGPEAQQAFAETVMNRAAVTGKSINQIISNTKYYQPYHDGAFARAQRNMSAENRKQYAEIIDKVKAGSDLTKGATHNASAGVAASARQGGYDSVKDSLIEVNGEWFYRKKNEDNSKLKRLPKETTKKLNLDSPKLTGAPNLDGITKINSDPSLPKLSYPHIAPDVTGDLSSADAKRIKGESDAIGIEPGNVNPDGTIPTQPPITPLGTTADPEALAAQEQADKKIIDQINAAAPELDYNERTGANKPATNNSANVPPSVPAGGGGRNGPESAPPKPGTGGYGSHMRCFLSFISTILTIGAFAQMFYINNLYKTSMEKTKYEQISYMVQSINRNTS